MKQTNADIILPVAKPTIKLLLTHGKALIQVAAISLAPPLEMFEVVTDKWLFANFLAKNSIPSPVTILYRHNSGFEQDIMRLRFPVLVKPLQGGAGRDIRYFSNLEELKLHFKKAELSGKPAIIQSYINGYDIDCSVLCKDGRILAYTIQKGFFPGKDAFSPPAGVDFIHQAQVYDILEKLMKTLNWSGVAHIDLRYDEDGEQFKVIEINPRYWASLIGSLRAGVNFPYLACLTSLGKVFPIPEYQNIRYMSIVVRLELLKQRFFLGKRKASPWMGETDLNFLLKDPLPEIFKCCSHFRDILKLRLFELLD
jgi:D-aspartate ligase